jgi:hypothetical protein
MDDMTYNTVVAMAASQSLIARVAACAAELDNTQARTWAGTNILSLVATAPSALQDAWAGAAADENANPDTGYREDVITDAMILAAVTTLKTAQGPGVQGWPA